MAESEQLSAGAIKPVDRAFMNAFFARAVDLARAQEQRESDARWAAIRQRRDAIISKAGTVGSSFIHGTAVALTHLHVALFVVGLLTVGFFGYKYMEFNDHRAEQLSRQLQEQHWQLVMAKDFALMANIAMGAKGADGVCISGPQGPPGIDGPPGIPLGSEPSD